MTTPVRAKKFSRDWDRDNPWGVEVSYDETLAWDEVGTIYVHLTDEGDADDLVWLLTGERVATPVPTRTVRAIELPNEFPERANDWESDDWHWDDIQYPAVAKYIGARLNDDDVPQVWVVTERYVGSWVDWNETYEVEDGSDASR